MRFHRMSRIVYLIALLFPAAVKGAGPFTPTWESIDKRPTPAWYDEAKFGIFIHWGLYSVPAWGPKGSYAEWYWHDMGKKEGETWKHHVKTYGESFRYQDFVSSFKAELFNPAQWASVFKRSGAKYVVLTSKHHDGFCLWPSAESWNWNSVDVGPHRDLAGDLADAVRAAGLKMGFYYSLYEWFHPLYKSDPARYASEHMMPQFKDLVTRYKPAVIFSDGEWEQTDDVWRSRELLAWLFNESPVKDDVVVNDRWGKDTRSKHGGYYTTEYGEVLDAGKQLGEGRKWEECRGIGKSFGYNRNEDLGDYATPGSLVHMLVDLVSKGGNLLLDIGPTGDGRIPVIMEERLLEIGQWLEVNGEAIYGTHPFRVRSEGKLVRYTARKDAVYAISYAWPGKELLLSAPQGEEGVKATLLGVQQPLRATRKDGKLAIEIPQLSVDDVPCRHAFVIKLEGVK